MGGKRTIAGRSSPSNDDSSREKDTTVAETIALGLTILDRFTEEQPERGVTDLANELGCHKSRIHRALKTLKNHGFLEQEVGRGKYRLGFKLLELGLRVRGYFDLCQVSHAYLEELSSSLSSTALIRILKNNELLTLDAVDSPNPLRLVHPVGQRQPAYFGASGKILLAFQPEAKVDSLLAGGMKKFTSSTISDAAAYKKHLEKVRLQGYALSDQEGIRGLRALAAPIRDESGRVIAALGVGMPSVDLPDRRLPTVVKDLLKAAGEISLKLGYASGGTRETEALQGAKTKVPRGKVRRA